MTHLCLNQTEPKMISHATLATIAAKVPDASTDTEDASAKAQLAISSELGLILIGIALLGAGSYMFVAKLCKSLASGGND